MMLGWSGKIPTTCAATDLTVEAFDGVVGPDLAPDFLGERGERRDVSAGGVEVLGDGRELLGEGVEDRSNWACTEAASGWS
jgi:hypothetical protein